MSILTLLLPAYIPKPGKLRNLALMKWIVLALLVVCALLASDRRVWIVPATFSACVFGYWYFIEQKPNTPQSHSHRDQLSAKMKQSSIGFAPTYLQPFLMRLSSQIKGGYSPEVIDHIAGLADRMEPDEKQSLEYEVDFRGESIPLNIDLFKFGQMEVAIRFHAPPPLSGFIENEMTSFFAVRGMRPA